MCASTAPPPPAIGPPATHVPPLKHGCKSHTGTVQLTPANPLTHTHVTPPTVDMHDLPSSVHAGKSVGGQMYRIISGTGAGVGCSVGAAVALVVIATVVAAEEVAAVGAVGVGVCKKK